jgi:hypothetical protein
MDFEGIPSVSTALQSILARKAQERHTRMLESISQQNADTSRMQAESYEKQREAEARWRDAQANKERLNDMYKGMNVSDSTASWMDQAGYGDLYDTVEKGRAGNQNPDGTVDEGPFVDTSRTYKGSPAEQNEAAIIERVGVLADDENFNQADQLHKALMLRKAGVSDPSKFIDKTVTKDGHVFVFDDATGKMTDTGVTLPGENSHFINRRRAPVGGSASAGTLGLFEETDEQGAKTGKILAINNKSGESKYIVKPEGAQSIGPRAGLKPDAKKPYVDESLSAKYATVRKGMKAEDIEQRKRFASDILVASPASLAAKHVVASIINADDGNGKNPYAGLSSKEIVDRAKGRNSKTNAVEELSPEDKQAVFEILYALRNK